MTALTILGLGFVTIGWLIQFYKIYAKKEKTFDFRFLVLYAVGAFALAYAGLRAMDLVTGLLNLATGIIALTIGYYTK